MKKLNRSKLEKFISKLKSYSIVNRPNKPSERSQFIARVGLGLANRAFKIKFKTSKPKYSTEKPEYYYEYCLFFKSELKVDGKYRQLTAGIENTNTFHGSKITIIFLNYRGRLINKEIEYTDLFDLELEEISIEKFNSIYELFYIKQSKEND